MAKVESTKSEQTETREQIYERRRKALQAKCYNCSSRYPEHCDYGCTTGYQLRLLETEFGDVTGCSHDKWSTKK